MENLEITIANDLMQAMKERNEVKLSALRSIKTAIQNEKTNGTYHELTDNEVIKVIQKLSKQRQEAADIYREANREELALKELQEKNILDSYLPIMLSEDELKNVIENIILKLNATTMKDMGRVMKELSSNYPNLYDGKLASTLIKNKLQ